MYFVHKKENLSVNKAEYTKKREGLIPEVRQDPG